jgi:chorismate synthase
VLIYDQGVGCIVDGVPPGLALTEADIQTQLDRRYVCFEPIIRSFLFYNRRPGQNKLTTEVLLIQILHYLLSCLTSSLAE